MTDEVPPPPKRPLLDRMRYGRTERILWHVNHAASMVRDLPDYVDREDIDPILRVASLESFFVNVRLLIEFLVHQPGSSKDFNALTLTPGWSPTPADVAKRLTDEWWQAASQQVVHFSNHRLRAFGAEDQIDVSRDGLSAIKADVGEVHAAWAQYAVTVPLPDLGDVRESADE